MASSIVETTVHRPIVVEDTSDALLLSKEDVLRKLESFVLKFLEAICDGSDPELLLVLMMPNYSLLPSLLLGQ